MEVPPELKDGIATMPFITEEEDLNLNLLQRDMLPLPSSKKGGLRTVPFIIANEAFEKVASYGLIPNMIIYLMTGYGMDLPTGTIVLSLWSATTNCAPIVGALISDSHLGRFPTIALGSLVSLLGMILLWATTIIPQAKPPSCNVSTEFCKSASPTQLAILYSSLVLISIGAGGTRACSYAFGADQLDKKENPKNRRVLQSFFNWYLAATTAALLFAFTIIVYIQDQFGWKIGFGVPAIFMLLSAMSFLLGSPFYVKRKSTKRLLVDFYQVIVAAFRNKSIVPPERNTRVCYHHVKGSTMVAPTEGLRFLNNACIVTNPMNELRVDEVASNPWSVCTVEQVEELKSLLKVIPLCSTGVILTVSAGQSFGVLQANSMDRHITSHIQIPAGSFGMFVFVTLIITIGVYDRLLLPLLVKLTGKPYGLGVKLRMGIGLFFVCMNLSVTAIVEGVRRNRAIKQGYIDDPSGVLNMSALWLIPQYCFLGLAEAFNVVAQNEFYYHEFPNSMSSVAMSISSLGMTFGNLITGLLINIVDDASKKGGNESWVSSNLNRAHYDYYYWLLTVLSCINFFYFLVCCRAYGPCEAEKVNVLNNGVGKKKEDLA